MINDEYTMSNTYLNDSVQTEIKFTNDTAAPNVKPAHLV